MSTQGIIEEDIWDIFSFGQMMDSYGQMVPFAEISWKEVFLSISRGHFAEGLRLVTDSLYRYVFTQWDLIREFFIVFLLLGVGSALILLFSKLLASDQIGMISYGLVTVMFYLFLLNHFLVMAEHTERLLAYEHHFLEIFLPCYLGMLGISSGITGAASFYQVFLCVMFLIEKLFLKIYLPIIYSYVLLAVINGLIVENRLRFLLDLIQKGVDVSLKFCVGILTGVNVFQSLIGPSVDALSSTAWQKACSMIPVLGNLSEGMLRMILGSASLLKNVVGVFLCILLLVLCFYPVVFIGIRCLMIRLCAGIFGVLLEGRSVEMILHIAKAGEMLLKLLFTGMVILLMTIAIACYSTGNHW